MKNKLILLRGLPGSGKSTYAQKYVAKGYEHFENDMFFMHDNKYIFLQDKAKDAANWCYTQAAKALRAGKNVVVSNVFVTIRAINRYKILAAECGADFEVIRMTGNFKNVHDVPKEVYASMKKSFQNYPGEKIINI